MAGGEFVLTIYGGGVRGHDAFSLSYHWDIKPTRADARSRGLEVSAYLLVPEQVYESIGRNAGNEGNVHPSVCVLAAV